MRAEFSAPSIHYQRDDKPASFWGLRGSASLHDKELVLTAVNPSVTDAIDAQIILRGAQVKSGDSIVLTGADIHARNTFTDRQAVVPKAGKVEIEGEVIAHLPAASVTRITLQLA